MFTLELLYRAVWFFFFFLNDPAPTEIYPLSLHDALPICRASASAPSGSPHPPRPRRGSRGRLGRPSLRRADRVWRRSGAPLARAGIGAGPAHAEIGRAHV